MCGVRHLRLNIYGEFDFALDSNVDSVFEPALVTFFML